MCIYPCFYGASMESFLLILTSTIKQREWTTSSTMETLPFSLQLFLISGGILTGVTLGLFAAIDLKIEDFYFDYIVVPGLVSSPIVATYVVKNFPSVTNKIAPIIAHIFQSYSAPHPSHLPN